MNNSTVICIIIPVYNTDKYLTQCLESVCAQTLRDIDIILIDDGSTDKSGLICDRYAANDPRIRVFHTENQGHYLAREKAIEEARKAGSKYIGFVDSDDWIEPKMFEELLAEALDTDADIVECGYFQDYVNESYVWLPAEGVLETTDALCELFRGKSHDYFWNKLWKISCFDSFAFPPARAYADMTVTYRIYEKQNTVTGVAKSLYHYRQISGSIAHQNDMQLLNLWRNNCEKYKYIRSVLKNKINPDIYSEIEDNQLKKCVYSIRRNWFCWPDQPRNERRKNRDKLKKMAAFIRHYTPLFGRRNWSRSFRITSFITRFPNPFSVRLIWLLAKCVQRSRTEKYYL